MKVLGFAAAFFLEYLYKGLKAQGSHLAENEAPPNSEPKKPKSRLGFDEPAEPPPAPEAEAIEYSADELDKIFAEEDPDFYKKVQTIQSDKNLSLSILDMDNLDEALFQETEAWRAGPLWKRLVFRLYPQIPNQVIALKTAKFKAKAQVHALLVRQKNFLYYLATEGRSQFLQFLKRKALEKLQGLKTGITTFKQLSFRLKLLFYGLVAVFIVAGGLLYMTLTGRLLPQDEELFLLGIDRVAEKSFTYDSEKEVEPFFENLRTIPNLLIIEKLVVNLKPSTSSGPTPMAAFELYLESFSSDALIETKRKEVAIKDLIQRVVEQFSFDDLESASGKKDMTDRLAREISRNLQNGKIKSVRIKTLILKP